MSTNSNCNNNNSKCNSNNNIDDDKDETSRLSKEIDLLNIDNSNNSNCNSNNDSNNTSPTERQQLFNILFFNNKYISKSIFKAVRLLNIESKGGSVQYKDAFDLGFIINNKHWSLLEYKMNRQEYLMIGSNASSIMSIKDFKLFKQCFEKYSHYFPIRNPPIVRYAIQGNNIDIVKYLVDKGYSKPDERYLEFACQNNNLEMLHYLYDLKLKLNVTSMTISKAILTSNLELLQFLLLNFRFRDGSQPIEKIKGEEYLSLYSFAQTFKMFKYLFDTVYSIRTNGVSRLNDILSNIISSDTFDGKLEAVEHLWVHFGQAALNKLALLSFKMGVWDVYQFLTKEASAVPVDYMLLSCTNIKNSFVDLTMLSTYLNKGVRITDLCLIKACKDAPFDVFVALWEQSGARIEDGLVYFVNKEISRSLVIECCLYNRLDIMDFLYEQGFRYTDSLNWSQLGTHDKYYGMVQLLVEKIANIDFSDQRKRFHVGQTLKKAAEKGASSIFAYLYKKIGFEDTNTLYLSAVEHAHESIVEYLTQRKVPFDKYVMDKAYVDTDIFYLLYNNGGKELISTQFIDNAAGKGKIGLIKWLHRNHPTPLSTYVSSNTLARGISSQDLSTVKFLLKNFKLVPTVPVMNNLGSCQHLPIVQYFYFNQDRLQSYPTNPVKYNSHDYLTPQQKYETTKSPWQNVFDSAMIKGSQDIVEFLYEVVGSVVIPRNILVVLNDLKQIHILAYAYSKLSEQLKQRYIGDPLAIGLQDIHLFDIYLNDKEKDINTPSKDKETEISNNSNANPPPPPAPPPTTQTKGGFIKGLLNLGRLK
ncbi:hypothetical protein CYY_002035 [Polysphondylium violaceum]|uniref:Ankyrin repeat-containing protein n=1 Tax=Polysphondylium violaceum TaxID=133409 RepID=A0A8J4V141_9MYCE|nr:hypothetical protein CYY_002035 [Polysphondylium violaceum]